MPQPGADISQKRCRHISQSCPSSRRVHSRYRRRVRDLPLSGRHGSFDLLAARPGDTQLRLIASGGSELESFQFDPTGTRLFDNGEDGLLVTDPDSRTTRRLQGTRGTSSETWPINMSADGGIFVYSAGGSCTRDAAEEADPNADGDSKRVCLAYLTPVGSPQVRASKLSPTDTASANSSSDPWIGQWNGSALSVTIRRGVAKPDYLVIDLYAGAKGCSGAVTLYGKPKGATVLGESYDPKDPSAPVCRVELSLDRRRALEGGEVAGPCTTYHGASCGFEGTMTRDK